MRYTIKMGKNIVQHSQLLLIYVEFSIHNLRTKQNRVYDKWEFALRTREIVLINRSYFWLKIESIKFLLHFPFLEPKIKGNKASKI